MVDSSSLKVMGVFEACARLEISSELACLAAHIYHRFFKHKMKEGFDVAAFATAAIKLAHRFFEQQVDDRDLILATLSTIHEKDYLVNDAALNKLRRTISIAERIILRDLEYFVNFKDDRMITPRQWEELQRTKLAEEDAQRPKHVIHIELSDESSSDDDDDIYGDLPLPRADAMLVKNCKYAISPHRYLLHYLKAIELIIQTDKEDVRQVFVKISNVAWSILCDYYWSSSVTTMYANHLACGCLMMAIEAFREKLENSKAETMCELWRQLSRKWNLIFCEDFTESFYLRLVDSIITSYNDYERVLQQDLNLFVIDPASAR